MSTQLVVAAHTDFFLKCVFIGKQEKQKSTGSQFQEQSFARKSSIINLIGHQPIHTILIKLACVLENVTKVLLTKLYWKGHGGGLVVSVLAFYFNDPSSNPPCYMNFRYEKTNVNKKDAHLFKITFDFPRGCQIVNNLNRNYKYGFTPANLERILTFWFTFSAKTNCSYLLKVVRY